MFSATATLAADTLIRRSPGPVETTVGSEIVLMSLEAGACYGLGETGSDVWRLLVEPITLTALVTQLRQQYQAPPGEIERDVQDLLASLAASGLIELSAV
jgi:hypothetical protein